jgi:glycerophosphoryl diester phosphodiesterase
MEEETFSQIVERTGGYPVNAVHRGGGDEFGPENTMHSFRKCLQYGARLLEIDLRLTKDGQLCIMHDSSVERTTDGNGPVYAHLMEELTLLDAAYNYPDLRGKGIGVPSFREFLDEFAPVKDLLFLFDFKDEASVRVGMEMVKGYPLHNRYMLVSVFASCNLFLRQIRHSPSVPVMADVRQTIITLCAYGTGLWGRLHFEHEIYGFILRRETRRFWSPSIVGALHTRGVRVLLCGEDLSREEVLRQCVVWGVDYIMTDRPDLLQKVLNRVYS